MIWIRGGKENMSFLHITMTFIIFDETVRLKYHGNQISSGTGDFAGNGKPCE